MPISGLVVTLSDDEEEQKKALATLEADDRITLGELQENRQPLVLETEGIKEGSKMVRADLLDIDGVVFVDVVTVNFEDVTGKDRAEGEKPSP